MKIMIVLASLLWSSFGFAAKTYQVTGPVLEVTDSKIIVEKGKDKWEMDRGEATKSDVKVGQKVTIEYTMTAKNIEVKEAKEKKKK
ncbi:hypothetical protein [Bdellovibrio svalbardensis]|uniref:DUF5666 domain-containing protein n=1 Tax=Bdellovibrio svalbardensis TaxID=2972972 RepID=A0ABT6DIQ7_9BACT|nr:hypothetical protein [Bdellovibrio svalbardensis]MDG0815746.1 hypothetical protein [Bdellovibrio svalbardensis]